MMKQNVVSRDFGNDFFGRVVQYGSTFPKHVLVGLILMVALFAFEIFNFDTTRYALSNLLGPVSFAGLGWATILAVAFCAIDFAGLVRLFTPEGAEGEQPKEVWYLMGAWLLGATMNALMTWWAVSLTLLNHEFGNEVLSRAQLLQVVPIFVAVLVWLTRILFIGALTVAGEHLMAFRSKESTVQAGVPTRRVVSAQPTVLSRRPATVLPADEPGSVLSNRKPVTGRPRAAAGAATGPNRSDTPAVPQVRSAGRTRRPAPQVRKVEEEDETPARQREQKRPAPKPNGRVRQRPPIPGLSASSRRRN